MVAAMRDRTASNAPFLNRLRVYHTGASGEAHHRSSFQFRPDLEVTCFQLHQAWQSPEARRAGRWAAPAPPTETPSAGARPTSTSTSTEAKCETRFLIQNAASYRNRRTPCLALPAG